MIGLVQIQVARDRLTAETERLNVALAQAEATIVALHLGVRGEVVIDPERDRELLLVFGKRDSKWCLFFVKHINKAEEDVTPLLNAPRAWRILAADHLDALVTAMFASIGKEIDQLQDKADKVSDFTERTKGLL